MKRFLLIALLLASPAYAGSDLTKSNIPDIRTLSVQPIPGTNNQYIQYSTTECQPPEQLLNKHVRELDGLKFENPIRVLKPGEFKTMDFNPKRINFGIDAQGYIRAISCG